MSEVLVFIDWYLPGFKAGGPVTSCANMIDALRDEVSFKVVTGNRDYCAKESYSGVDFDKWVTRRPNEEVMYISDEKQTYRHIRKIISETSCDIVYINGIYSRKFSIYPILALRSLRLNKHVIVASRGMLSKSAIGVKRLRKSVFLQLAKWFGWYHNVVFHATNQKEKEDILREVNKDQKVYVASNFPRKAGNRVNPISKQVGRLKMISIARIAPEKNLIFLLKALKDVKSEVQFDIYGSVYNQAYWDSCREVISHLPGNINVEHQGFAKPIEVQRIIQDCHVLALPSLGENYGHVIAESLIAGRPVLISDQTPWRDLRGIKAGMVLPLDIRKFSYAIEEWANMDESAFAEWLQGAFERGSEIANDPKPRRDHLAMFRNE